MLLGFFPPIKKWPKNSFGESESHSMAALQLFLFVCFIPSPVLNHQVTTVFTTSAKGYSWTFLVQSRIKSIHNPTDHSLLHRHHRRPGCSAASRDQRHQAAGDHRRHRGAQVGGAPSHMWRQLWQKCFILTPVNVLVDHNLQRATLTLKERSRGEPGHHCLCWK